MDSYRAVLDGGWDRGGLTLAGRRPEFRERTFFAALSAFSITNRLMLKPAAVGGLLDALLFFLADPEGNLFTEPLLGPSRTVNAGCELPGPLHTFFHRRLTSPL